MIQKNKFKFDGLISKLNRSFKKKLTKDMGQHTLLFFRLQFKKEGTEKSGFQKWKERKGKYNTKILVKSGTMRDSMKVKASSSSKVKIRMDSDYAIYHQEGTTTIDKREMFYESVKLDKQIENIIEEKIDSLFKL